MRVPALTLVAVGIAMGCFIWFNNVDAKKTTEIQAFSSVSETVKEEARDVVVMEAEPSKAIIEEDIDLNYVSPYDFMELHAINEDIVAWMSIPGTLVDYPIVFNGTESYLHEDLNNEYSYSGTPFVDKVASKPMKDSVNVVYGHHMKDGSMFAAIDQYNDQIFFQEHSNIKIFLTDQEMDLSPVAVITGKADSSVRCIDSVDSLNDFAEDKTITAGGLPEEDFDDLYVFVTCNYTGDDFRTYLICTK